MQSRNDILDWGKNLTLFAASFLGMVAIIHFAFTSVVAPLDLYAENRSEKLTELADNHEKYSVAAVGSSRIHSAFDPRVFDETFNAEQSTKVRSVNLAVAGGSQTEQYAMARHFIEHAAQEGLPEVTIILELSAGLNLQNQHLMHPRAINLYDQAVTRFGLEFSNPDLGLKRYAGRVGYVAAAGALHRLNVGFLSSAVFQHSPVKDEIQQQFAKDRRGFIQNDSTEFKKAIDARFAKSPSSPTVANFPMQPGYNNLVTELSHFASVNGVKANFVYVFAATLSNLEHREDIPASIDTEIGPIPVVDFSDMKELADPKYWNDPGHLSYAGAIVFSRLLAERAAALGSSNR